MKKLIIAVIMLLGVSMSVSGQSVQREGNTFTQVSTKKSSGKDNGTPTKY